VAALLKAGNNYQEVSKKTGASTATISRVNKCLNYGTGGYNLVLDGKESK
jgi:TrpR-related protein YerC/YecD